MPRLSFLLILNRIRRTRRRQPCVRLIGPDALFHHQSFVELGGLASVEIDVPDGGVGFKEPLEVIGFGVPDPGVEAALSGARAHHIPEGDAVPKYHGLFCCIVAGGRFAQ